MQQRLKHLPSWSLQNSETLTKCSYFRDTIYTCVSSIRICSPWNRTRLDKALAGLSSLKRLLNVQPEISYEKLKQSRFKRVYVVNHYSCCPYVNNQDKFTETRLNLQTEKTYHGYLWWKGRWLSGKNLIFMDIRSKLLIVFEVLCSTYKLDWTPNFPIPPNIWLELSKIQCLPFSPTLLTWNCHGTKIAVSQIPRKLKLGYLIKTSVHEWWQSWRLLQCGHSETHSEHSHRKPENLTDHHCLPSLHLKMLMTQHPELFLVGCSPNSETSFIVWTANLCLAFISVEMSLIKLPDHSHHRKAYVGGSPPTSTTSWNNHLVFIQR